MLGNEVVKIERKIRKIEEENHLAFDLWRELQQEKESVVDKLKTEARKQAEIGGTQVLLESSDIFVSVSTRAGSWIYNVNDAERLWPEAVFAKVVNRTIDAKAVQALIESNQLSQDKAAKAGKVGDPPTPAVTVRFP